MGDKKNQIEKVSTTPAVPLDYSSEATSIAKSDLVKEISVSEAALDVISEKDQARKKKVADLKKQYEAGELKAKPSAELAQRLLKKLGF